MENRKNRVLVVDDTEATRYAVARTLKANGYDVLEAANGTDALILAESETPDLITLDIHLPDIIGFEVCRRIKANPATSHIPVLQVSASYVTSKDRIHGLEGGADSYLTHPFEPPVLIATIKALLRSRQLTDKLRLTEEKFNVALKHAPIMIYTADQDLKYSWIYNVPKEMTEQDFLGKTDLEIFPAEEAKKLMVAKSLVLKTGLGQHLMMSLTLGSRVYHYDMTIEPHRSANGKLEGLTVACINISDRIKLEIAQKKAFEDAEYANQAKTRFLSNMSHEIRTPLGVIQGFADLAADPTISELDRNQYLATIKRNAFNLTKLLGEILDLTKIEAERVEIEITRFSLPELFNELTETLSMHAKEKALQLNVSYDGTFPEYIFTDAVRLRQILMNVLGNALKFTEQGQIEVIAKASVFPNAKDRTQISVLIRDTGIGLSTEQQEKLFQPFVQADSSTTRKYGGTGLGLDLSKKLAHLLGGDLILAESAPGKGSTFVLTFDAGILESEAVDRKNAVNKNSALLERPKFENELNKIQILLVEDSVDNQMLFSRYLKNTGAIVEIANDGIEALEKVAGNQYDLILMDVQMPRLDGYGATKRLRDEGYKNPIIALTAHALKEERDRALNEGFTDYLTKPLNVRLLVETVKKYHTDLTLKN